MGADAGLCGWRARILLLHGYSRKRNRVIRNREVSLNWDRTRGKVYFEFGNWFN